VLNSQPVDAGSVHHLTELVYELLDAHEDTRRLVDDDLAVTDPWRAHLDYLQRLQRVGREIVAEADRSALAGRPS
jgi:hypothetical protein